MKTILLVSFLFLSACATNNQIKTFQDRVDKEEVSSLVRDKQMAIAIESLMKSCNEHLIILHQRKEINHEN